MRRVLLGPIETAAVATAIRDGLRTRGDHAELWTTMPHPFLRTEDRRFEGYAARARAGAVAPRRFDVLHFQFGTTYLEFLDAAWGKVAGRPLMLMHYWGDDCRFRLASGMRPIGAPPEWDDEQRVRERTLRRRLRLASRLCAAALVSDLELARYVTPYFRTVYVLPTPLALPLRPAPGPPRPAGGPLRVLHAPSHQLVKGTSTITAAVERLAARRPIEPVLVSGMPRDEVLREIGRADVVVDQLNQVTIGVFALESMSLGVPVLTQYDRGLLAPFQQDVPAVPVTAETLEAELERVCEDAELRRELGAAGAAFVPRVHDAVHVAGLVQAVYDDAPRARAGLFEVTPGGIVPIR